MLCFVLYCIDFAIFGTSHLTHEYGQLFHLSRERSAGSITVFLYILFVPSNPQEVGTNKALLAKCNRLQKENDRLEDIIAYLKTQVESGDFKQKPQPPR